jgi:hypothetical protein
MPRLNIIFAGVCVCACEYVRACVCVCVFVCIYLDVLAPGFTYTSAEVKDYPAPLEVTCRQHVESPAVVALWTGFAVTNEELFKFLTMLSWHQSVTENFSPTGIRSSAFSHCTNSKQYTLNHIIPSCQ